MAKEIKINKKKVEPNVEEVKEIVGARPKKLCEGASLPIGAKGQGCIVGKPQTDFNEVNFEDGGYGDEKIDSSRCMLTDEEEKEIVEKLANGRNPNELIETIEELPDEYDARKCIDKETERKRLPDELKIAKYLTRQYKENMKKILAEREYEDIKDILNSNKKEEIDSVIEELIRLRSGKCNKEKSGVPEPIKEAFKKLEYVAPECKTVNEDNIPGDFDGICRDLITLHARKNKDYGNAAHESYKEFGLVSYVIRLNDKLNRLKSLTKPGATMEIKDESIIDTLKDLAAYSIMAIESMLNG